MKIDHNSIWHTQTGESYAIKDMTTSHIENCISLINVNFGWRREYLQALKEELKLRKSPLGKALG